MPAHLLGWLPEYAQWTLYQHACAIWTTRVLLTSWTHTRITLLYKKGDTTDASNYKPIAVSSCMYHTPGKLILLRLKKPLIDALSPEGA